MKNNFTFSLLLVIICIFALTSGCIGNNDKSNIELHRITEEESSQIAEDYVRNLESYKTCNLTEPVLIGTRDLNCSSCWQFIYKFDLISEKDPDVVDTVTVTVTVIEGEIVDVVYTQGGRY